MDDLDYRKIKNYYRRHKDIKELRRNLLCLFFDNIEGIPIAIPLDTCKKEDIYYKFPYYFENKHRDELINIFNKEMSPVHKYMKPLDISSLHKSIDTYDISGDRMELKICSKTFRPYYRNDWRKLTEEVNGITYDKQKSFYNDYIKYYLRFKTFPSFYEFIHYVFYKYNETPVHKDIYNVYCNINNSYRNIKEYIKENNLTYKDVSNVIKQSTNINQRILLESIR